MKDEDRLIWAGLALLILIMLYKRAATIINALNSTAIIIIPYFLFLAPVLLLLLVIRLRKGSGRECDIYGDFIVVKTRKGTIMSVPLLIEPLERESSLEFEKLREISSSMGVSSIVAISSRVSHSPLLNFHNGSKSSSWAILWVPYKGRDSSETILKATISALNSSVEGVRFSIYKEFPKDPVLISKIVDLDLKSSNLDRIQLYKEKTTSELKIDLGEFKGKLMGIPVVDMTKHILIVGQTGSGKTTTTKRIVWEAWNFGIPSLIFDIHWEYKNIVFQMGGRIYGVNEELPRICINPLLGIRRMDEKELYLIAEMISSVIDLSPSQFYLLIKALKRIKDQSSEDAVSPTMLDLIEELRGLDVSSQAEEESRSSLLRKLEPLLYSEGSVVLECDNFNISLLERTPALMEMGDIKSDTLRQLLLFFFLRRIREHYVREGKKSPYPRIIVVIEEAEKLIPGFKDPTGMELVDRMFSELRKFGVSLVLVSQNISELPTGVVRNTGIKILHRIESPSDLREVKSIIRNKNLLERVASLNDGECLISSQDFVEIARVSPVNEINVPHEAIARAIKYFPYYWSDLVQ